MSGFFAGGTAFVPCFRLLSSGIVSPLLVLANITNQNCKSFYVMIRDPNFKISTTYQLLIVLPVFSHFWADPFQ